MKKLNCYVFDYIRGGIFKFKFSVDDKRDDEDILYDWGFSPDACEWMITHRRLRIKRIRKPLNINDYVPTSN